MDLSKSCLCDTVLLSEEEEEEEAGEEKQQEERRTKRRGRRDIRDGCFLGSDCVRGAAKEKVSGGDGDGVGGVVDFKGLLEEECCSLDFLVLPVLK